MNITQSKCQKRKYSTRTRIEFELPGSAYHHHTKRNTITTTKSIQFDVEYWKKAHFLNAFEICWQLHQTTDNKTKCGSNFNHCIQILESSEDVCRSQCIIIMTVIVRYLLIIQTNNEFYRFMQMEKKRNVHN